MTGAGFGRLRLFLVRRLVHIDHLKGVAGLRWIGG